MITKLDKTIGFIGAGNMAEAFIHGLLDAGICLASDVCVSDIRRERLEDVNNLFAVDVTETNSGCVDRGEIIVLAVKPQNIAGLLEELSSLSFEGKLVLSIVAGVTTTLIEAALKGDVAVIRVMPNTPALIGEGISVWARGRHVKSEDIIRTELILRALGRELEVEEELMNAATALSGSGPAYVFYLLEAMVIAGEEMGFSYKQALSMAMQTVIGAARLTEKSGNSPQELRRRVTSPGGTTASAIKVLETSKVKKTIVDAIKAACKRAGELSEENK